MYVYVFAPATKRISETQRQTTHPEIVVLPQQPQFFRRFCRIIFYVLGA